MNTATEAGIREATALKGHVNDISSTCLAAVA